MLWKEDENFVIEEAVGNTEQRMEWRVTVMDDTVIEMRQEQCATVLQVSQVDVMGLTSGGRRGLLQRELRR